MQSDTGAVIEPTVPQLDPTRNRRGHEEFTAGTRRPSARYRQHRPQLRPIRILLTVTSRSRLSGAYRETLLKRVENLAESCEACPAGGSAQGRARCAAAAATSASR